MNDEIGHNIFDSAATATPESQYVLIATYWNRDVTVFGPYSKTEAENKAEELRNDTSLNFADVTVVDIYR